jgi:hypothetical protein
MITRASSLTSELSIKGIRPQAKVASSHIGFALHWERTQFRPCDRLLPQSDRGGLPSGTSHAKVNHDDSLLGLARHFGGLAQTVSPANRTAPSATDLDWQRQLDGAPVGHRQPRAYEVPSDKDLSDPNDPINRENAALTRRIKGICRGC